MFGLSDGTWLYGGAGNDFLMSMSTVEGARGHLYGGTGDDRIFASDAISFAYGGTGNDEVSILFNLGGEAAGGSGIDTLVLNLAVTGTLGAATDVSVTRGGADAGATAGAQHMAFRGFEILDITTNTGDDTVRAGNFDDRIDVWSGAKMVRANGGNDVVSYRTSDANYLNGGAGEDTLFVVEADPIVSFGFSVNGAHATDGAGSVLLNFEHYSVIGGLHNDVVLLGALADEFRGLAGDDSGLGMAGADRLWGGGAVGRWGGGAVGAMTRFMAAKAMTSFAPAPGRTACLVVSVPTPSCSGAAAIPAP